MFRFFKRWNLRRKIKIAVRVLPLIEPLMKKAGIPRQQRRFFWRSMANDEERDKAIKYLAKAASDAEFKEVD